MKPRCPQDVLQSTPIQIRKQSNKVTLIIKSIQNSIKFLKSITNQLINVQTKQDYLPKPGHQNHH